MTSLMVDCIYFYLFQNEGPGRCTYCHLEVPNLKLHLADVHASKLYVNCKKCDKPILGLKFIFTKVTDFEEKCYHLTLKEFSSF